MWLEGLKQGVRKAPRVVWLSDGARGLWRLYDERFQLYAIGVLDFYHAAQNVWSGVKVWLDGHTTRCQEWFTGARHRLRHGQANDVLDDIKAASALPGLPDSAEKALTKLYGYLKKHQDHIQYDRFTPISTDRFTLFVGSVSLIILYGSSTTMSIHNTPTGSKNRSRLLISSGAGRQ